MTTQERKAKWCAGIDKLAAVLSENTTMTTVEKKAARAALDLLDAFGDGALALMHAKELAAQRENNPLFAVKAPK